MTDETQNIPTEKKDLNNYPKNYMWLIIAIVGVLLVAGLLTLLDKNKCPTPINTTNTTINDAMYKGYQYGVLVTIDQVINKTSNCQIMTIGDANTNRTVADVECFKTILRYYNITI